MKQPNRWSCGAAAVASLLDKPLQQVIDGFGHDGSEVVDPNARFPTCYKGYPMEEIIDYCLAEGVALVQITAAPMLTTDGKNEFELWTEEECLARVNRYMDKYDGLLIGPSQYGSQLWHVIAWDHEKKLFYDSSAPEPLQKPTIQVVFFYIALHWRK